MRNDYFYQNIPHRKRACPRFLPSPVLLVILVVFSQQLFSQLQKGKIVTLYGSVLVQRGGSWLKAEKNMLVNGAETIKTGAGASAKISFADGSFLVIAQSSLFKLGNPQQGGAITDTKLLFGGVTAKLSKMKAGSVFELQTPTVVAGVRGTLFNVGFERGVANITADKNNSAGSLIVFIPGKENEAVEVVPGKALTVSASGEIGAQTQPPAAAVQNMEVLEQQEKSQQKKGKPALTVPLSPKTILDPEKPVLPLNGKTDSGMEVEIKAGGQTVANIVAGSDGAFSCELDLSQWSSDEKVDIEVVVEGYNGTSAVKRTVSFTKKTKEADSELVIIQPEQNFLTKNAQVPVRGTGPAGAVLDINGIAAVVDDNGNFGPVTVTLDGDGVHKILISGTTKKGKKFSASVQVTVKNNPPVINDIILPLGGNNTVVSLPAQVLISTSPDAETVTMNGRDCTKMGPGQFRADLSAERDGTQTLNIEAVDIAGNKAAAVRTVVFDIFPPDLTVREPIKVPVVSGVTEKGAKITVTVAGTEAVSDTEVSGSFTFNILQTLKSYDSEEVTLSVWAADIENRKSPVFSTKVLYDSRPPVLNEPDYVISGRQVTFTGNIEEAGTVYFNVTERISIIVDQSGSYVIRIDLKMIGSKPFLIEAVDKAGNRSTRTMQLPLPSAPGQ